MDVDGQQGDSYDACARRADALLDFAWAVVFERDATPEALR